MIDFRVERPLWTDAVEIYGRQQLNGKSMALVCNDVLLIEVKEGSLWPRFLELSMDTGAGQSLFDALWKVGFRPNNGESSVAHVNAINRHLEDMRTLVFKSNGKE